MAAVTEARVRERYDMRVQQAVGKSQEAIENVDATTTQIARFSQELRSRVDTVARYGPP